MTSEFYLHFNILSAGCPHSLLPPFSLSLSFSLFLSQNQHTENILNSVLSYKMSFNHFKSDIVS